MNRPVTPMRAFAFGLVCLALGWIAAGALEANRVDIPGQILSFLLLVIVVAAAADRFN